MLLCSDRRREGAREEEVIARRGVGRGGSMAAARSASPCCGAASDDSDGPREVVVLGPAQGRRVELALQGRSSRPRAAHSRTRPEGGLEVRRAVVGRARRAQGLFDGRASPWPPRPTRREPKKRLHWFCALWRRQRE